MLIAVTISTLVVFSFFLFPVTDFDIWWHMAGGQFMVENWQFPYADTFSYTAFGNDWNPNSWGFTALSYLGFDAFGLDGLNIIKAITATLVFAVIAGYVWWRGKLNWLSLAFITFALYSVRGGFSLRPHTFAYLVFATFLILLAEYKRKRSYKIIAALAVLQFFWVNFHASFIFGIVLTGFFILSELYNNYIRTKSIRLGQKEFVLIISILIASLAHVFYGYNYLIRIVSNYISPQAQLPIREVLPFELSDLSSLMGIVLIALIGVLYFSFKRRQFDILLSTLFIGAVAVNTGRFARDLVIFLAFVTPFYLGSAQEKFKEFEKLSNFINRNYKKLPNYAAPGVFYLFLLVLFLLTKSGGGSIGLGVSPYSYPIAAVEFIQQEQLLERSDGQLYNTYNFGGYLMWANQPHKVAMDGRARPYLGEPFNRYWTNFEGTEVWTDSVERYNITVALMTLPHISGGTVYNRSAPMFPADRWALIYYDDIAMMYVQRIEAFAEIIVQHEYAILDPQQVDFAYLQNYIDSQEKFEETVTEINRGLALNPESYRLFFTRAYVANLAGLQEQVVADLERTLEINPNFEAAKNILQTLEQ